MKKVLVSLPDKLLEELDALVERGYYSSRSELFRDAVRVLMRGGFDDDEVEIPEIVMDDSDISYS